MFKLLSIYAYKKNQSVELINTNFLNDVNVVARSPSPRYQCAAFYSLYRALTHSITLNKNVYSVHGCEYVCLCLCVFYVENMLVFILFVQRALHTQNVRIIQIKLCSIFSIHSLRVSTFYTANHEQIPFHRWNALDKCYHHCMVYTESNNGSNAICNCVLTTETVKERKRVRVTLTTAAKSN